MSKAQWKNLESSFDHQDLDVKISFNEFLFLLQQESFYRDSLAESQIYRQSAKRLEYGNECKLISRQ